jgi:acyl-homoserine lactone synthase
MIHIVTAANRALYAEPLREMHRLRWDFYVEQRNWRDLRALQTEPGFEYDQYDDDRAIYLLALSPEGAVEGAMRLRPTDDKSLLFDRFPNLVDADYRGDARLWEITRLMRAPDYRGSDGALRLKINCAACELALARGIRRFVAVMDTFLLPAARALNRNKHRVLGLPHDYAEGEMIAVEFSPDAEWLAMGRGLASLTYPMMLELPPPAPGYELSPRQEAAIAHGVRTLSPQRAAELIEWLGVERRDQTASAA